MMSMSNPDKMPLSFDTRVIDEWVQFIKSSQQNPENDHIVKCMKRSINHFGLLFEDKKPICFVDISLFTEFFTKPFTPSSECFIQCKESHHIIPLIINHDPEAQEAYCEFVDHHTDYIANFIFSGIVSVCLALCKEMMQAKIGFNEINLRFLIDGFLH